jgi:hypothetical protein
MWLLFLRLLILKCSLNYPSYLEEKTGNYKGNRKCHCSRRHTCNLEDEHTSYSKSRLDRFKVEFSVFKVSKQFILTKTISQNTEYQIRTSNEKLKDYEKLNYQISVVKDQFPTINVNNAPDSLKLPKTMF